MTLVKTKHRPTPNRRKVSGEHHRKNQHYLKPYWPYIPLIAILGGGAIANSYLPASFGTTVSSTNSARIDSVVGSHNGLLVGFLTVVLVVIVAWFALRHLKQIKKLALEGEKIVAKNFMLDVVLALIIAGLYVMVR